ncbi:radical SAM protein [bacterium]|nr:radical SAM protein [bacterium]
MSRVLLLNPPGSKNYIRDYFCSKLSKANYISPPIVLLMLSGILSGRHEVMVQDGIVEGLSVSESLIKIQAMAPEVIITLVGAASWEEDKVFLRQLKEQTPAYIIAVGDLLLEDTEKRLQEVPEIEAALLNFVTEDVLTLIEQREQQPIPNTVYRSTQSGSFITGGLHRQRGDYRIPTPRHELFPLPRYRFPFMLAHPMTAMLTDYGCPFGCTFCVIPNLGFGLRPIEDIIKEMQLLQKNRVREIFFLDQTFGVRRDRTLQLCEAMESNKFKFQWSCFSRADVLNHEMLDAMARVGCHTIIFGVESGSDATLEQYHKKMNLDLIRETLSNCRKAGIRVAATFMLGLPGETEAQARKTIQLALELPLDYAAFNVAVPRAATQLRKESIAQGLIDEHISTMDQSGIDGAISTQELSAQQILVLRKEALIRFYLRPGYLLRRLFTLRSWTDFVSQIADGWGVVMDALKRT